ncbi:MAG: S8 family peptidase [bacterium]|nr:S8 family peptidase [bacterium]
MKILTHLRIPFFLSISVLVLANCSSTGELAQNSTVNEPTETETVATEAEVLAPTEDWHLLSPNSDPYFGTGVELAYEQLLADKQPRKEVIVAIIDSGTDIEHEDLAENIWINEDEIAGNGIDDDGNGYVDDIHGWNFIGGADGSHVIDDTYEVTRIYASLRDDYEGVNPADLNEEERAEYEYYQEIKADYLAERNEVQTVLQNIMGFEQAIMGSKQVFGVTHIDSVSAEDLEPDESDTPLKAQAKQVLSYVKEVGLTEEELQEAKEQYQTLAEFGMNPDFDPRGIVGDDYDDLTNRFYGNNDVAGPRSDHGTHVAGIVGAIRNNSVGMDGIADVKLMIVRTVPMGDERDKDVANAIRYAAENGADIINMSFGKGYSPQKAYVDAAVRFADSLGVLMIHGAGNDGANIDTTNNFPSRTYSNGGIAINFMNIGASSWEDGEALPAVFSNYGSEEVDLFAPGVEIYSTYPENEYKANDGTSMAAPVVSGVAALIMAYYPDLTATQVKEILMDSSTKPEQNIVNRPGSGEEPVLVPFSELSISGGIVNAFEALKMADQLSDY